MICYTWIHRLEAGGEGVLPAAFHLLPFSNTFILCSLTQAKMLGFNCTSSSNGNDQLSGERFIGKLDFLTSSRAAFLSKDVFFLQADVHLEILHNNANGSSVTLVLFCVLRQRHLRYLRICVCVTHRKI